MVESESDDGTETPQQLKYFRAVDAMLGDEGSLTSEDKQEIQQLREDDGRGDNLSIARRTRSNLGDNLGGDEKDAGKYGEEDLNLDLDEGEEDDLLGDISDDSYDMQDLPSLEGDSSDDVRDFVIDRWSYISQSSFNRHPIIISQCSFSIRSSFSRRSVSI